MIPVNKTEQHDRLDVVYHSNANSSTDLRLEADPGAKCLCQTGRNVLDDNQLAVATATGEDVNSLDFSSRRLLSGRAP